MWSRRALVVSATLLAAHAGIADDAESGWASWYGWKFHGRLTASGEVYDMNSLTAAHRTLPFGTIVRVSDTESDATVEVRINDRGPFVDERIIDVSRAAAARLGMTRTGLAHVRLEIVQWPPEPSFVLQLGSFREASNAQRLVTRAGALGVPASLMMEGDSTRVLTEPIAEKHLAAIEETLRTGGLGGWLRREVPASLAATQKTGEKGVQ